MLEICVMHVIHDAPLRTSLWSHHCRREAGWPWLLCGYSPSLSLSLSLWRSFSMGISLLDEHCNAGRSVHRLLSVYCLSPSSSKEQLCLLQHSGAREREREREREQFIRNVCSELQFKHVITL